MERSGVLESKDVGAVEDGLRLGVEVTVEYEKIGPEGRLRNLRRRGQKIAPATSPKETLEGVGISKGCNVAMLSQSADETDLVLGGERIGVDFVPELCRKRHEWKNLLLGEGSDLLGRSVDLSFLHELVRLVRP